MEQEPTPIIELLVLILFLGSITFLLGAIFQGFVLYKNKKSLLTSISVIILTRILTVISSYFIWEFWHLPFDIMLFASSFSRTDIQSINSETVWKRNN